MGIGFFLASATASRLVPKLGRGVLTLGTSGMILGYVFLLVLIQQNTSVVESVPLVVVLFVEGLGQRLVTTPLITTILARIDSCDVGTASGVFTTTTQIANALGVAIIGLIFANEVGRNGAYVHGFITSMVVILGLGMLLFLFVFLLPSKRKQ